MNKYIKSYALAACALLTLSVAFSSCKKDKESPEELMERNYPARVYLQGDRYSAPSITYTLTHGAEGVAGTLEGKCYVRLSRAQAQDVVVTLKASIDKEDLQDAVSLSSQEVTVKAGQLASDEVTFTLDKAKLETRNSNESYVVSLAIDAIKSAPAGLLLSTNQNHYAVTFAKQAQNEDALTPGIDYTAVDYLDDNERATKWRLLDVTPGIDGAGNPTVLFDGQNTDLAANNRNISFTVDFGRVVPNLKAVYVQYFNLDYMPLGFRLECSEDGQVWKTLGNIGEEAIFAWGFSFEAISFKKVYAARYIRYTSTAAPSDASGRSSITEFYAFTAK